MVDSGGGVVTVGSVVSTVVDSSVVSVGISLGGITYVGVVIFVETVVS